VAWTLPETLWRSLSRPLGRLYVALHPNQTGQETAQIAALLGGTPTARRAYALAAENCANRYEERFHYLRAWRPGGWAPSIDIEGAEHVSAALERGHGIVFWGGNFAFNNLVAKMAMHRLGLEVTGFSVPVHGISPTRFGIRYLNRLYRDIENRYLQERLMVAATDFRGALQRMCDTLHANGAVYFTVGGRGRRTATAKFLEGNIVIATGPCAMAHRAGAALLPLYTFRAGPSRFKVTIGPAIEIPKDGEGNANYQVAVQAYAEALTPFVLLDPGQWHGWYLTRKRTPWGGKQRRASASHET
jgi:lauroyl/myristoyl acyltransferase